MDLRDFLDLKHGLVGHVIGPAKLAFHMDEDRLHRWATRARLYFEERSMKAGVSSPKPVTGPPGATNSSGS